MAIVGARAAAVTFCMSDIEGSTRLWESHPRAMAEALARHDGLIAAVVEAHGGRFVKSMGEGDSTTSVFDSPIQAVTAALEAIRALEAEPWPDGVPIRVRFGLHTGEAEWRDGVYLGRISPRVRSAGDGGEILLSDTAAALVAAAELPPDCAIVDLGRHRLTGIDQPQPIKAITGGAPMACRRPGVGRSLPRHPPRCGGRMVTGEQWSAEPARARLSERQRR